jgi:GxxExxY protein
VGINEISGQIVGAAIAVHRELGPGLLESTYKACLLYELVQRGLRVEPEKPMSVVYKGTILDCGYRLDILVERCVIVELKVVERLEPIHAAQLLTYLKLSGHRVGLLINFNVQLLRDGLRRLVLDLPE